MPIKPPTARPHRQSNPSSDDTSGRPERAERVDSADTLDHVADPIDRAAPVDGPESRGPTSSKPSALMWVFLTPIGRTDAETTPSSTTIRQAA